MKSLFSIISILILLPIFSYAESHHPEAFLEKIKNSKDPGQQIVAQFCVSCHSEHPAIPVGAPSSQSLLDWRPRVLKGRGTLFKNTDEGLGAMPPRGGCFECSDEQLWAAILAMLPLDLQKELLTH